ncbi:uncharacterized protein I303_107199 [Kwoniella dejecticola CBS 10117]|uniref:DUF7789 domain-containing protein n=1 Tax=Kwoniella dejecticola CBS 10117 TaxID=1296121 RepID=A0A1A5ZZ03_9TREE|nr:uncharacterized protein I303_06600 [Kwoniella dejecticola CBS 10117]OBR83041.1 hypothetical protein I303_06600 [Kwoniella dejecticola CBS 10117]
MPHPDPFERQDSYELEPLAYPNTEKPTTTSTQGSYRKLRDRLTMDNNQLKKSRHALPTRLEKVYMATAAFEAVVIAVIAFAVFGLVQANIHSQNAKVRTVPVYLAVFIMAQIFSVLYIFDALRARNIVQLIMHLFFNLCMLIYSILQIPQTKDALSDENGIPGACGNFENCTGPDSLFNLLQKLMIVPPIIFGICTIAFCVMIKYVHAQFGWAVFHLVGASPELRKAHTRYQTMISLLKMLLFFGLAFCTAMLILASAWSAKKAEFIVTIIAFPVVIIFMLGCGWALRKENKPIMYACLVLEVTGIAYFIYKLATLWLPRTEGLYSNTKITMAIFSIFSIIILLATFLLSLLCIGDFGKGLIDAHRNPENRTSLWSLPANARFEKKMEDAERYGQAEGGHTPMGETEGRHERLVID